MATDQAADAAHILLDVVSAFDWDAADSESNADAMGRALEQFNEHHLVDATIVERSGNVVHVAVDTTPILTGAVLLLHSLIETVQADHEDMTSDDVIARLRAHVDNS